VPQTLFIMDDDEAVRESLQLLLESAGHRVRSFASGSEFLAAMPSSEDGCLIIDVRMPGIGGLDVQERLRADGIALPVIVITGHADVPLAVRAMKAGAVDFVEKPFAEEAILAAVERALEIGRQQHRVEIETGDAAARLAPLSEREQQVLRLLIAGKQNKVIAYELGISPRTVEIHRARVMEKTRVRSLSELVRLAVAGGISPNTS
jgi:two-component system, LuxR family, response regulator FixJ